jgi:diguanylate cyclase (GGDEF)-like protein/PAS domain S-box-containing protein
MSGQPVFHALCIFKSPSFIDYVLSAGPPSVPDHPAPVLIYFISLILYLRRNNDPRKFDIQLFFWLLSSMILVIVINLTRPAGYAGNFTIDVILILLVYLGMPMRLLFRCTGAIIFTIGEIITFFFIRQIASPVLAYSSLFALLMANVGGIFASGILYSFRRNEFKAQIEKTRVADEWQATFDSISDLISIQDADFKLVRVNKAFADTFGMKPEDLIGKHCYEIVHGTTHPIENCPHEHTMKTGETTTVEVFEPRLGLHLEISTSPISTADKAGSTASVHLVKDITVRKQLQQKLEETATHDFLTGLPNRMLLNDRYAVAAAEANRDKCSLAIMSLDLDNFKLINDSLGHAAGDEILKSVALRLTDAVRSSDTVARIGGDEFILLLQKIHQPGDAESIAAKIIDSFKEPFKLDGQIVHATTSIGIALYPRDGADLVTISHKSDSALYRAKGQGRNNYQFYF